MPPDPLDVRRLLGGVATAAQLAEHGVTQWASRVAAGCGRLEAVRRCVVADPALHPAVRHALAHGGRSACHSVLTARGVWMLDGGRIHLHSQRKRDRTRATGARR